MRPSGKVNLIAVVILGAIAYGIWWVITFSGVYLDNIDVKEAVEASYNESGRVRDDARATIQILGKLNRTTLGNHEEDDGYGTIKTVGGLGLKEENVTIVRDEVASTISIVVEYQRRVLLKPLSKVKFVKFRVAREGPIPPQ